MQPARPVTSEFVDAIYIGSRLRNMDADRIATLAGSIKRHGLLSPITIVYGETVLADGEVSEGPILVAGLHRLKAVESLGWQSIDCYLIEADEIEREMLEIVENLHRLDLTKDERDRQVRRYAELLATMSDNSQKGVGRPESVATKVAAETGLSDRTVRRILADDPEKPKPKVSPELAQRRAQDHLDQNDARDDAERAAAALLAEHVPGEHWAALLSYLEISSAKAIAKHFRTLNGSVFDNTSAGRPDRSSFSAARDGARMTNSRQPTFEPFEDDGLPLPDSNFGVENVITQSCGGVEHRNAATANMSGSVPEEEAISLASGLVRGNVPEAAIKPCAEVMTGPQDTPSTAQEVYPDNDTDDTLPPAPETVGSSQSTAPASAISVSGSSVMPPIPEFLRRDPNAKHWQKQGGTA